jgi:hypothetical protein
MRHPALVAAEPVDPDPLAVAAAAAEQLAGILIYLELTELVPRLEEQVADIHHMAVEQAALILEILAVTALVAFQAAEQVVS